MKQTLKRLLRRAGFVVVTRDHSGVRFLDHPPTSSFDAVMQRMFSDLHGLNFVQIGANDGRRFDPLHAYIHAHDWRGVLLEPLPHFYRELTKTYAGNPRLTLVQAAVDASAGERTIHHVRDDVNRDVPEWLKGLASFDREKVAAAVASLGWPESTLAQTAIRTLTWADVWAKCPHETCDVLAVDTEGFDIPLLRLADLRQRRPRVVHFEHMHHARDERLAFYAELMDIGYELATDGIDTTAWLPDRKAA